MLFSKIIEKCTFFAIFYDFTGKDFKDYSQLANIFCTLFKKNIDFTGKTDADQIFLQGRKRYINSFFARDFNFFLL